MIHLRHQDFGNITSALHEDCLLSLDFNGNVMDKSIYANHALVGIAPVFVRGRRGYDMCAYFQGKTGVKTRDNIPIRGKYASVSFWMKTKQAAIGVIVELSSNYNYNKGAFVINNRIDGVAGSQTNTEKQYNASEAIVSKDDEWRHYVFVFDRTLPAKKQGEIYINGKLALYRKVQDTNLIIDFFDYPISIGARELSTYPFNGYIQDLKIFKKALNVEEIIALYNE